MYNFIVKHFYMMHDTYISPFKVLPLRARVDLGAMAMKEYSSFPKAPAIQEPHHRIV